MIQRRRNGPPESNPALIKMRKICALTAIWCAVGAEIIALISIFAWGSPWSACIVPGLLGAAMVVLYRRSASKETPK
ncbi:hypothetical protein ACTWJ8_31850 [Streptomyces sp. SDT5-1]|uniref:hypothetical protein n=1 Tax=Streptomyces sp. SDT5-1 TaxID=3406418 RepID=UPI003FD576C2